MDKKRHNNPTIDVFGANSGGRPRVLRFMAEWVRPGPGRVAENEGARSFVSSQSKYDRKTTSFKLRSNPLGGINH